MNSSRSNRTTRRATRQLVELSAFVTTESDLSMLLDRAAQLVRRSLCVDGCRIFTQSTDAGKLDVIAGEGDELGGADAAIRALAHNALDAYAPSTDPSKLQLSDAARRRKRSAAVPTESCRISGVSVVIEGESAPFGAMAVYSITPRVFSRADVEFARLVASILTGALRRIHHLRDRARLTTVVTCANEAIVELTAEGRIFNWNRAAESMFGYSADQAVGAPLPMLFAPGHSEEALAMLDYVCRGAVAGPFEKRLQRSDGTQIDAEVLLAPVVVPGGRISAASMIAHDIGHKRVTDRALLMHADILGHMPAGVFVWRLDDFKESSSLRLVLAQSGRARGRRQPARGSDRQALRRCSARLRGESESRAVRDGRAHGNSTRLRRRLGGLLRRIATAVPRSGVPAAGPVCRGCLPRRDGTAGAGRAASPRTAHGSDWPPDRLHRARLQQPADGHQRARRAPSQRGRYECADRREPAGNRTGLEVCRAVDPTAARLWTTAGDAAGHLRSLGARSRIARHAEASAWRRYPARCDQRRRGHDTRRRRTARASAAEPRRQRARCHAGRRTDHHRIRPRALD